MKVKIKHVTLIAVDCVNYYLTIKSLRNCMDKCEFDKTIFCTDIDLKEEGIDVIKIDRINSKEEYSKFIIKELYKHFDTLYCLIVQHDGTILNADCWDERFYKYSYIGAKWNYPDGRNVGNGGFSMRSWKLQSILGTDDNIEIYSPEDEVISRLYRNYLEFNYDIQFPPETIADKFSFELNAPYQKTFGHHAYFHLPFKEHIILKRTAAAGDVIMLEPVISYYCDKGYQVVLDTLPQFMELFSRYKCKILHISEMDNRVKPIKCINFDLAYESKPKQLVLKSYIELTGENIPLRNSQLYFPVDGNAHLFERCILIHIDETGMPHRNCQGVNWNVVVAYYTKLGYLVFQIGKRMREQVAPYLNTTNIESLMFMLSGCSLLIGLDSSPLQIAVGLGTPAIGFFGSVNPALRYLPTDRLIPLHSPCVKPETDFCYHSEVGTTGVRCIYYEEHPPCVQFSEYEIIKEGNKLLNI